MPRYGPTGPWGRGVLASVRRDLGKGWPPGLTTLTGADLHHLDLALDAILDAIAPDRDDPFALTVLRDGRMTPAELVDRAASRGMFASTRIVLLRDPSILDGDPEPLTRFAADPPEQGWIVVRAPKLDRKRKLHQVLGSGRLLEFRPPEGEAEGREFLEVQGELAKERGVRLDPSAAAWVAASAEGDLLRTRILLDQLRDAFPSSSRPLTEAEVAEVAPASESATGWELADHLAARDGASALADARRYEAMGEEVLKILGGLAWRARRDSLILGRGRWSKSAGLALPAGLLAVDRSRKSRQVAPYAALERLLHDVTSEPPGRKPR